jgi:hypothetical protein
MKDFSRDFFPDRSALQAYLSFFKEKYKLNVKMNCKVEKLVPLPSPSPQFDDHNVMNNVMNNGNNKGNNNGYNVFYSWSSSSSCSSTNDQDGRTESMVRCKKLVMATGISKPHISSSTENLEKYSTHYAGFPKDHFKNKETLEKEYGGKRILIVGNGNAAFELANHLVPFAGHVNIYGRNRTPRLSIVTHYSGDVRSQYLGFYDTFLLKTLNSFDYYAANLLHVAIEKMEKTEKMEKDVYHLYLSPLKEKENRIVQGTYDRVINCTGWEMDTGLLDTLRGYECNHEMRYRVPPRMYSIQSKYPLMNGQYEHIHHPNLYFIGSLMHIFDQYYSAGGFIHGFRYLIRNFMHMHFPEKCPWPCYFYPLLSSLFSPTKQEKKEGEGILDKILLQLNTSSALYQMYGQVADIFWTEKVHKHGDDNGDGREGTYIRYFPEVTLSYFMTALNKTVVPNGTPPVIVIMTLEYGKDLEFSLPAIGSKPSKVGTENISPLLHPVFRFYKPTLMEECKKREVFFPQYASLNGTATLLEEIHLDEDLVTDFTCPTRYRDRIERMLKGFEF